MMYEDVFSLLGVSVEFQFPWHETKRVGKPRVETDKALKK